MLMYVHTHETAGRVSIYTTVGIVYAENDTIFKVFQAADFIHTK